ncbi:MAG: hypothetical protein WCL44_12495 [bacterium]
MVSLKTIAGRGLCVLILLTAVRQAVASGPTTIDFDVTTDVPAERKARHEVTFEDPASADAAVSTAHDRWEASDTDKVTDREFYNIPVVGPLTNGPRTFEMKDLLLPGYNKATTWLPLSNKWSQGTAPLVFNGKAGELKFELEWTAHAVPHPSPPETASYYTTNPAYCTLYVIPPGGVATQKTTNSWTLATFGNRVELVLAGDDIKAGLYRVYATCYDPNGFVPARASVKLDGISVINAAHDLQLHDGAYWHVCTVVVHKDLNTGGYMVRVQDEDVGTGLHERHVRDMVPKQGYVVPQSGVRPISQFAVQQTGFNSTNGTNPVYLCVGESAQFTAVGVVNPTLACCNYNTVRVLENFRVAPVPPSTDATVFMDGTTSREGLGVLTGLEPGHVKVYCKANLSTELPNPIDVYILKVDILDPAENDVHLKGEEVKFDGEVEPTGLSGLTYAWSVLEGTCDPATATTEDFQTTLKSEGIIKVKLAVTVGGTTCEKIRTIKAMLPEVTKLSWNDDHDMTKWGGGAISDPVWVKTLGGGVTKNEPGTYTKDAEAKAELAIEATDPLTHSTSVQVKGVGNKENFYAGGATFHNWTWSSGELVLDSSPLYSSVNFYDTLDVTWYYCVQKLAGGWGDWVEMDESSHILYTVNATPAASPLYDRGVDKGCRYANGATDFAGAINSGLAGEIYYDPRYQTSHDLSLYDWGYGQCCCHAAVFSLLIAHVTDQAPVPTYCWGGCSSATICFFKLYGTGPGWWWGPSFQCQRPATDYPAANPHFTFHVEVPFSGTVYDPSYGLTGWASLLETAPAITNSHPNAASFQSGASLPSTPHQVDWICGPH